MKAWIVAYRQWSTLTGASKTARSPLSGTTLRAPVQNDVIVLLTGMLLERTGSGGEMNHDVHQKVKAEVI